MFDQINKEDMILAFFPCIRFEDQSTMIFQGTQWQLQNKSDKYKLENCLKYHKELSYFYEVITKLAIVCINKEIPLMIENPYSETHYLTRYWAIKPKVIDKDRSVRGDFYKKPTQYWFINCEPHHNIIFKEQVVHRNLKIVEYTTNKAERSLISPIYARNFIEEFILDGEEADGTEISLFDLGVEL